MKHKVNPKYEQDISPLAGPLPTVGLPLHSVDEVVLPPKKNDSPSKEKSTPSPPRRKSAFTY